MKASDLYKWLFAEGEHTHQCEISVDGKYIKEIWWITHTGELEVEFSDCPTEHFCNEDVPCFFSAIPLFDKNAVVKIACIPIHKENQYKEVTFSLNDWINDISVNPLNSLEYETINGSL